MNLTNCPTQFFLLIASSISSLARSSSNCRLSVVSTVSDGDLVLTYARQVSRIGQNLPNNHLF
eukprot:TRINITY_DN11178_c0_g1_i1.p3 TRINITY_DN11178_c0_g1~~TRINITY_DN11178_c0_g1_i1.p3  ORF type:complete len:63 (-),score=3.80 TRINITY_DN11178_c0_g1_i1:183-371(-)